MFKFKNEEIEKALYAAFEDNNVFGIIIFDANFYNGFAKQCEQVLKHTGICKEHAIIHSSTTNRGDVIVAMRQKTIQFNSNNGNEICKISTKEIVDTIDVEYNPTLNLGLGTNHYCFGESIIKEKLQEMYNNYEITKKFDKNFEEATGMKLVKEKIGGV